MSLYLLKNKKISAAGVVLAVLLIPASLFAETMQGSAYKIQSDSINVGGTELSSGGLYRVSDTVGEAGTGESETLLSRIKAGYRQLVGTTAAPGGGSGGGSGGTSTGGGGAVVIGSGVPLSVSDLSVRPGTNHVEISLLTNKPAYADLVWGLDGTFTGGTGGHADLTYEHTFSIDRLTPQTRHYVQITLRSGTGEIVRQVFAFTTLSSDAAIGQDEVANPSPLTVEGQEKSITISWKLPIGASEAIVVRSTKNDGTDNEIIFRGPAENFIDSDVVSGSNYFYTVYAVSPSGKQSSGATAIGALKGTALIDPYATYGGTVDKKIAQLSFFDIDIIQNGVKVNTPGSEATLASSDPFVISIDYEKLPEVLKTIAVTLTDTESEESFTFILRVNAAKTGYRAVVGALKRAGTFKVSVTIADHENRGVRTLEENIKVASIFSQKTQENIAKMKVVVENLLAGNPQLFFLALLLVILVLLRLISRRFSSRS